MKKNQDPRSRAAALSRALSHALGHPKAAVGLGILALFLVVAIAGPLVSAHDASAFVDIPHQPPSSAHVFGTTGQGQDVFAQTIAGARTSLFVGLAVGLVVTLIGATIGALAGTLGGLADGVISLVTNIFLVIPSLPLAVVIAAYAPPGPATIFGVLVLTGWAWTARVVRSQVLSIRKKDFVTAAITLGEGTLHVVFREILPNMTPLVASCFIGSTVYAIGAEVGLEFLGLGDTSRVTWGTNLYWASNDSALLVGAWWTIAPTGISIALVGTALALLSFAIDDLTNPKLAAEDAWRRALERSGVRPTTSTPVSRRHD